MRIRRDDVLTPLLGLAFLAVGYWTASQLMQVPKLQPFKVLNVAGLVVGMLGVVLLSQFVASHDRYKHFVVNRVAPQIISFFAGFPTGMVAASVLGETGPSRATVWSLAIGFQTGLAVVGVIAAKIRLFPADPERLDRNVSIAGAFLIGLGFVMQLIASLSDMFSG
jgi:hypothetical protein